MIPSAPTANAGPSTLAATTLAFVATVLALAVLVRCARRSGFADDGRDAPERKTQRDPVPLVGGTALLCACGALAALEAAWVTWGFALVAPAAPHAGFAFERTALASGFLLAFSIGLIDDLAPRGLPPGVKLAGQIVAGIALASGLTVAGAPAGHLERALVVFLAVAAQNVANTFDHADGTLGSIAFLGSCAARAPFAGAVAAFLGANLARRSPDGPPRAYLGDSGSHLLGLVLLATPAGQAALLLPAIDLARVVVERLRAGEPVWRGDRRHLGQRLADAGRSPLAVVGLVLVCAAPALVASTVAEARGGIDRVTSLGLGAAGSAALLGLVLWRHPRRARG